MFDDMNPAVRTTIGVVVLIHVIAAIALCVYAIGKSSNARASEIERWTAKQKDE